jgi:hypothetical protein
MVRFAAKGTFAVACVWPSIDLRLFEQLAEPAARELRIINEQSKALQVK